MTQPPGDRPDRPGLDKDGAPPPGGSWPQPWTDAGATSPFVTPGPPPTTPYPQGPEAFGAPPPPSAYPPVPSAPHAPYGGWVGPGYPFAQAHGGANAALGLGITSVVSALLTGLCCLTAVGILAGPFAIALGLRARTQMRESPGLYRNQGAATAGLVTGIVGTVLGLAITALVALVFGSLIGTGWSTNP